MADETKTNEMKEKFEELATLAKEVEKDVDWFYEAADSLYVHLLDLCATLHEISEVFSKNK